MPVARLYGARTALSLLLAGALLLSGCLETTFNALPLPQDVQGDAADALADAGDSVLTDLTQGDGAPDDAVAEVSDVPADVTEDAGPPDIVIADAPDAEPDTSHDIGPTGLPLGHTCTLDDNCASMLCIATSANVKTCTTVCDGDCDAGLRCGIAPSSGSTSVHYCLPLPGDLCRKCTQDSECAGGVCLTIEKTQESICGVSCGTETDGTCPAGFVCQSFIKGLQCVPVLDTCTCSSAVDGEGWSCALETPLGKCNGSQLCSKDSWSQCSAPLPTAEVCDSLDNDCDGLTDETFTSLGTACGVGICAGGKHTCSTDKKGYGCSTDSKKLKKELCGNGLDDDCNGQTDENCPPKDVDGDGTPDLKDCAPYQAEVHPGAKEPCCKLLPVGTPGAVTATDLTKSCDFNCDTQIAACGGSDSDGDGHAVPDDCDDNNAKIYPGAAEKCGDSADQDCDGKDLICDPTLDSDGDSYMIPADCDDDDKGAYPGAAEKCNNIDDDCDKVVDNGNPGGGGSCGATIGACKPGFNVCSHVGLIAQVTCTDAQGGEPETCNLKDDNCDGKTDEEFSELGSACDTDDADECKNGKVTCSPDGLGTTCAAEAVFDLIEQCKATGEGNTLDDNCNGTIDEVCYPLVNDYDGDGVAGSADCNQYDAGFFPDHPDTGGGTSALKEPCCPPAIAASSQKIELCDRNCDGQIAACAGNDADFDGHATPDDCNDSDPQTFPTSPDKCGDGIDQDCDGTDLDCAMLGDSDGDGDGYPNGPDCKGSFVDIHPYAEEICNGKDDDCDGLTDEGNPGAQGGSCGSADGQCQPGQEVCVHYMVKLGVIKAQVQCVAKVGAQPELCNSVDDNCNGKTDEYFPKLTLPCDGPDSDQCKNGTATCAADGKDVVCVNETIENLTELCDGIDNDCNGQTDEGLNYFGKKLGANCKGQGACGDGTVVCSPELQVAVCSTDSWGTTSQAVLEVCDGIDNDCDGFTDEGMLYAGTPLGGKCNGNGACGKVAGLVECAKDASKVAICSTMLGGSSYQGKAEVCNGVDDNCDGHVDEGLGVVDSTCKQTGVCTSDNVKALCKLGKWQCNYTAVAGYQGDKEILCDGVDNDCDGQSDEEFLVGLGCDGTDTDQCKNGIFVCSPDKLSGECGSESVTDITELCNAKDDDCDGQSDEDFPVAQDCDGVDGDNCKNGKWSCSADGSVVECINETVQDLKETCNGLDDDCNGATDEAFPDLEQACDGADTDQCTNGVTICSPDGKSTVCGTEALADIVESCNGVDDDCDGTTDEGQLYQGAKLGEPCTGVGACGPGNTVCSPKDKVATCSSNPNAYLIFDGKELCDGLDNDCNGEIDDALSWKGIALGAVCDAGGECGTGKVECASDKQVTCSTLQNGSTPKAKTEVCNLKDDDCDGQTDNALTAKDSDCKKIGVCATDKLVAACTGGVWSCDYSAIVGFQDKETLCDGLDNDCNGLTDEGFDIGSSCDGPDTDQCKKGTWSCSADGSKHECLNESLTSIPEVCDGADNDCNGQTDESFLYDGKSLGETCDGFGECGNGTVVCGKNLIATCSTNPDTDGSQAKPEVCDSLDNDCNSKTDDSLKYNDLPVGAPCSGIGECGLGTVVCASLKPVCSTNPGGPNNAAKTETCNAKDDDCNGSTDESLDPKKSTCNQIGVCGQALAAVCSTGKWQCQYAGFGFEPKEISCDSKDNDCNGVTDDPYPSAGKSCDGPDTDQCKFGKFVCDASQKSIVCDEAAGTSGPTAEICDGIDNDCNGDTDENWPELTQACDGSDKDYCANGSWSCSKDGKNVVCNNEFIQDIIEICNSKDDDCNGLTDDGLGLGLACDGADTDQCKNGVFVCGDTGKVICSKESKENIIETCNDKDDDCDGTVDNGFAQKGERCDSTDWDNCETGINKCANGAMVCVGDVACATGGNFLPVTCKHGSSVKEMDVCLCGAQFCSLNQGDTCNKDGSTQAVTCNCGSAPPCTSGQVCAGGVCK